MIRFFLQLIINTKKFEVIKLKMFSIHYFTKMIMANLNYKFFSFKLTKLSTLNITKFNYFHIQLIYFLIIILNKEVIIIIEVIIMMKFILVLLFSIFIINYLIYFNLISIFKFNFHFK